VVGQMLSAVGIKAQVDAIPAAIYFRRWATMGPANQSDFSATISMFGSTSGLASEGMNTIIHSPDPEHGLGASNRRFFSDPKLDAMLAAEDATFDEAKRETMVQDTVRYAMQQRAVLPLFFVKASWGVRKGLTMTPRQDQYTMATTVRKAP
jgi:peptide/nickel transport system substrate-binding protein